MSKKHKAQANKQAQKPIANILPDVQQQKNVLEKPTKADAMQALDELNPKNKIP